MPLVPQPKYQNYSDPAMRDRIAFREVFAGSANAQPVQPEPSGFTSSGWDKYYFFSDPYQGTFLHPTAVKGRLRPSMAGPQTFCIESFTKDDLQEAGRRLAGRGNRSAYSESFSQLPRTRIAVHGPMDLKYDEPKAEHGTTLTRQLSEPLIRERTAADILLGTTRPLKRTGPHWPPATAERPDPVKVRAELMGHVHRTLDDLHSRDRQAPGTCNYTITNF
mmetsp:Transcript_73896/g.153965  ORF Transcript_73896/g.153965 Transcript_73896/m.153965 type:complete len:220 (+) Transcript_73896:217-876(+)